MIEEAKKIIEKSGRKKKWIAEQMGFPYATFQSYICGYRTMPNDFIKKLKKIV